MDNYTFVLPMVTDIEPYSNGSLQNLRPFLQEPKEGFLVERLLDYDVPLHFQVSVDAGRRFLCISIFPDEIIERYQALAPYESFLREGPFFLTSVLYKGVAVGVDKATNSPALPTQFTKSSDTLTVARQALSCDGLFVIYVRAGMAKIYSALVSSLLDLMEGEEPNNEPFESYKNLVEAQNSRSLKSDAAEQIKKIKAGFLEIACTYHGAIAALQKAYLAALPLVSRKTLADFNNTITAICEVNKESKSELSDYHKEMSIKILDQMLAAMREIAGQTAINTIIKQYIEEITRDEMHKYLTPLDGTRPFIHKGTAIIDTDACRDEKLILETATECDRLILLGGSNKGLFGMFLRGAGGLIYESETR